MLSPKTDCLLINYLIVGPLILVFFKHFRILNFFKIMIYVSNSFFRFNIIFIDKLFFKALYTYIGHSTHSPREANEPQ